MILSCFHTTIMNHFRRNNVLKGPPSEIISDAKIHRNTAKLKSIYYRHKVTLSQVLHPPQKDREITSLSFETTNTWPAMHRTRSCTDLMPRETDRNLQEIFRISVRICLFIYIIIYFDVCTLLVVT